ncbi:gluconokinase [Luteimicrobium sp. DT211]|uniref:gluconokinase n=1 Tax=Luteimicrobium sp. DT211 TaxID=3393412 RepID=UPI003CF76FF5
MTTAPVPPASPVHLVVMGVSGTGKTTVGRLLADRLGWAFAEGDAFHPPANVARMQAGTPLDDAARLPWLRAIRDWTAEQDAAGTSTVVTCSALRTTYRDVLREAPGRTRFVHLVGDASLVGTRMQQRAGHFMPPSLLPSQLATLEPLGVAEDGVVVPVDGPPAQVAETALSALGLG